MNKLAKQRASPLSTNPSPSLPVSHGMLRFAAHHLPDASLMELTSNPRQDVTLTAWQMCSHLFFRISHLPLRSHFHLNFHLRFPLSLSPSSIPGQHHAACPVRRECVPSKLLKLQSCGLRQQVSSTRRRRSSRLAG